MRAAARLGFAAIVLAAALPGASGQESANQLVLLTGDALRNALVGKYSDPGSEDIEAFCADGRWYRGGGNVQEGRYELKFDQYCIQEGSSSQPICSQLFARPDGKFESHIVTFKSKSFGFFALHNLSDLSDPTRQMCSTSDASR